MRAACLLIAVLALAGCQKKTLEVQAAATGDAAVAPSVIDAGAVNATDEGVVAADVGGANANDEGVADVTDAGAGAATASAPVWRVKDNKVRCIQAPCMSLDAMPVSSSDPTVKISDVDLSALGLSAKEQQALMSQLYGKRGLQVAGEIVEETPKSGRGGMARVLKVDRVVDGGR